MRASLAREMIQNSLDARSDPDTDVHVSFELIHLEPAVIGGDELADAIDACMQVDVDDRTVAAALQRAANMLRQPEIPCLRVSDRNTIGLRGDHWRALVKMQGVSHKADVLGAGGSHGIGKYAPFAVSSLRTVFYWTSFEENGCSHERFQGKAVLMSHDRDDGEAQGTGFYGRTERCSEVTGKAIPERFRLLTPSGQPVDGTSVVIAGFESEREWRRRLEASILSNYFYAIGSGKLSVTIEPDEDTGIEMTHDTLAEWFDNLIARTSGQTDYHSREATESLRFAQTLWKMSSHTADFEKQDGDLGHCRLWVRVDKGLPSKVAIVRRSGMLITTTQSKLIRFPGYRDFAALCVFEDPGGNELLRRMENPKHDQLEPDRLPEQERARGRRSLNRISTWIREQVRSVAGPPVGSGRTVLTELATYLPDLHPEEPFDGDGQSRPEGGDEPGFATRAMVTLKPIRRPRPPSLAPAEHGSGEADGDEHGSRGGDEEGDNGGHGGGGGSGEGDGTGRAGERGGNVGEAIALSKVRLVPIDALQNRYELSFHSEDGGTVALAFHEAGDSSAILRTDVQSADNNVRLSRLLIERCSRTTLTITADEPIGGRAWRVSARVVGEGAS